MTDRSGDANVLSAIDPAQYDAVNVEWDSEKQDFVSPIGNPKDDEVDKMTVVRAELRCGDPELFCLGHDGACARN